jgi:hypothetical protein|tara:strand:- start:237 stop:383 length:147 start_codon:yes stop_codon:yes gene_type:complete
LSAEDAALVKTLLKMQDEFQQQQCPVVISQDGLKTMSKIYYTNKFKGI